MDRFWEELVTKKESPIAKMRAPLSARAEVPKTLKITINILRECIMRK